MTSPVSIEIRAAWTPARPSHGFRGDRGLWTLGACPRRPSRCGDESSEEDSDKATRDHAARDDDAPADENVTETLSDAMSEPFRPAVRMSRTANGLRRIMQAPKECSSEPSHDRQAEDQVAEFAHELASLSLRPGHEAGIDTGRLSS
jgi:hypothetical protein